jgi:hypothetical protein
MVNPFEQSPVDVSQRLTSERAPPVPDRLAIISLNSPVISTVREGVNRIVNRLLDAQAPKSPTGKVACLLQDEATPERVAQELLSATLMSKIAGTPALLEPALQLIQRLCSDRKKVIVVGNDEAIEAPVALRRDDDVSTRISGFLSSIRRHLASDHIEYSYLQSENESALPHYSRAAAARGNAIELQRFQDKEVLAPDGKRSYTSETRVILIPFPSVAGIDGLTQRFTDAPEVAIILTPTALVDDLFSGHR